MDHRYPFACLSFDFELHEVDVNVHPTKQEVRFSNRAEVYNGVVEIVSEALKEKEDISTVKLSEEEKEALKPMPAAEGAEPFEKKRLSDVSEKMKAAIEAGLSEDEPVYGRQYDRITYGGVSDEPKYGQSEDAPDERSVDLGEFTHSTNDDRDGGEIEPEKKYTYEQQVFLTPDNVKKHRIIGQVFDTFWLVEFDDCLYMIDQHAAHEKVLYERTMERIADMKVSGQRIDPPILISLSETEKTLVFENRDEFNRLGYDFDDFGDHDIALTQIPEDLFGIEPKRLFTDMVADLSSVSNSRDHRVILERIASMSCKAAVKGHDHLSMAEIETLISDLLSLEDPYHCPHGRPTIIRMTHYELDKKFKRIV